jgi:hypothetical protein
VLDKSQSPAPLLSEVSNSTSFNKNALRFSLAVKLTKVCASVGVNV